MNEDKTNPNNLETLMYGKYLKERGVLDYIITTCTSRGYTHEGYKKWDIYSIANGETSSSDGTTKFIAVYDVMKNRAYVITGTYDDSEQLHRDLEQLKKFYFRWYQSLTSNPLISGILGIPITHLSSEYLINILLPKISNFDSEKFVNEHLFLYAAIVDLIAPLAGFAGGASLSILNQIRKELTMNQSTREYKAGLDAIRELLGKSISNSKVVSKVVTLK